MSDDQERVHMAMWAMWSSPLIISNDLRSVKRSSKRLLLNKNVIRINQDELGRQARIVVEVVLARLQDVDNFSSRRSTDRHVMLSASSRYTC